MNITSAITYFDQEGSEQNLQTVLRVIKKCLRKRNELRNCPLVFFTAFGQGPAIAFDKLEEYSPRIIAVTFPPTFYVKRGEEHLHPEIPPKILKFFEAVDIKVVRGRLPFDAIASIPQHTEQMNLVKDVLSLFGGSFVLCVQAVLQACDHGLIDPGQDVIGITGDCAAIVTASTTDRFLSKDQGMVIREILCKPRTMTLARRSHQPVGAPIQEELLPPSGVPIIEGSTTTQKQLTNNKQ